MKPSRAYKHKSFRDLAFFITKAEDTDLGLEIEFSWVVIGVSKDTIISKKESALLFKYDLVNWNEYKMKDNVMIIDSHYGVENDN